jgi:thioredoxin reductase (NADPH)
MTAKPMGDCLVIGGCPKELTAAFYLAGFRLTVQVIDRGAGRTALIPLGRNYLGFLDGISGRDLIQRIRARPSVTTPDRHC